MVGKLPDASNAMAAMDSGELARHKLTIDALKDRMKTGESQEKKLRETAQEFESVFIQKLWQQMRKSVPKEGYLHSKDEDFYLSMFDQELARKLSGAGGIGLGDMLYNQLSQQLNLASRHTSAREAMEEGAALPVKPLDPEPKAVPEREEPASVEPAKTEPSSFDNAGMYSPLSDADLRKLQQIKDPGEARSEDGERMAEVSALIEPEEGSGDEVILPTATQAAAMQSGTAAAGTGTAAAATAVASTMTAADAELSAASLRAAMAEEKVLDEVDKLASEIEERQSAVTATGGAVSVQGGTLRSQNLGFDSSRNPTEPLEWPVEGVVSSRFGWRRDPFTGSRDWHGGIDIAAPEGSSVKSCWPGEVVFAGDRGGYGKLVVVDHGGGWRSYYGHNSELDVKVGDHIGGGTEIAKVGSTGRSTGPHVHFELRQGTQAWDPDQIRRRMVAGLPIGQNS